MITQTPRSSAWPHID